MSIREFQEAPVSSAGVSHHPHHRLRRRRRRRLRRHHLRCRGTLGELQPKAATNKHLNCI